MKFKHDLEMWHKIGEFAKHLVQMADWNEIKEIKKCKHYEFDGQSAEDYCHHPSILGDFGAAYPLNGKAKETCWECYLREVKEP